MNFFTVRSLRSAPKTVWEALEKQKEIVITNNGKPTALMISIDDTNFEDVLATVRQANAMRAVNRMRMAAAESGASRLAPDAIDVEIAKARKERAT
ncbi:MAG: type II toxin-antitoxin system Phd/YefM family antitoxin [Oscillospiraceae bacterium]|nr:type II toxin-antitoxin system Phd/YefM family antitoxin [Oscillospiraceae bacterium]